MSKESDFQIRKVAILGLGLIGGSLALALQENGLVDEVIGLDRKKENLDIALERKAINWGTSDFIKGVKEADLIIIATPVRTIIQVLKQVIPYLKPGCLITDVGSTKLKVVEEVEAILPSHLSFVGGHPMAGSEQSGMRAAKSEMFQGAAYIFTPTEKTNRENLNILQKLIRGIGCRIIEMTPQEHDLAVASISHLPHILAVSLVSLVGKLSQDNAELFSLAAGGFRDTTRVASSHPVMWRDICLTNKDGILKILEEFENILQETKKMILEENSGDLLLDKLTEVKKIRESIPICQKGGCNAAYSPS